MEPTARYFSGSDEWVSHPACNASTDLGAGEVKRHPFLTISVQRLDRVDETGEHTGECRIRAAAVAERSDADREQLVSGLDLERKRLAPVTDLEGTQESELQVVHALVRDVQPTSDTAEDQSRDSPKAAVGGDGQQDRVALPGHGLLAHLLRLAAVASAGDFEITTELLPSGSALVRVNGELDLATTPQLEDALSSSLARGALVVDLTLCTFLETTAIRILVRTARSVGDGMSLVASDPSILRVLELARVDTLVPLHSTLEAAL